MLARGDLARSRVLFGPAAEYRRSWAEIAFKSKYAPARDHVPAGIATYNVTAKAQQAIPGIKV